MLIFAGGVLVTLGWCWHLQFPAIKKIWSSSFVLVAGGWSAVLLGIFYGLVDVLGFKWWTPPFVWVGANPITLYLFWGFGFFSVVSSRLVGPLPKDWAWLAPAVTFALMLLTARFLYQRKIFLRV
jgi:predicted acyltransferase